jgi:alpha-L-fucosidase 2
MALVRAMLREKILPNLWDTHPPFQIDGNFGYTAGVSEALVGSSEGVIRLLPALPEEWNGVRFEGLVARGAFEISLTAKEGKAVSFRIQAGADGALRLSAEGIDPRVRVSYRGKTLTPTDGVYTVEMARGTVVSGEINT